MHGGRGMGGGGGGGSFGGVMRQMRRDTSVLQQEITKGTARRMLQFARPYRKILTLFLVLIVVDAVIGVANPLMFRAIIDTSASSSHDKTVIVGLALVAAGLAVIEAGLSVAERWVSAKVGEGLIFDMRSQVFGHIQKMPIAFFTRTQTGALISRLNNDVLGAQQAFTDTFSSVVGNVISVTLVLVAMFFLSWQITLVSLVILPVFVHPGQAGRPALAVHHPGVLHAQRPDDHHHDRAVQRGGRPAGQAVRPTRTRSGTRSSARRAGSATSASPRPCTPGCSSPP